MVFDTVSLPASGAGVLSGSSFVAKDLFAVAGHTASFGHPRWRDSHERSEVTAPVLQRLTRAGAGMLGLTKLDQLAYSLIGNVGEGRPPLNSLYPDRFTGGSSSGAASAVAGGVCDFGLGSDTAGSIRVPAASCGLFAIRPTHGALDSAGALPLAPSFDVVGLLASEPQVLRDAFWAASSHGVRRSAPLERVLLADDCLEQLDGDVADVIVEAATVMREQVGVQIGQTRFARFTDEAAADLFARLQAREIWSTHGDWIRKNREFLATDVQARLERAEQLSQASEEERARDAQAWARYRREHDELMGGGSAILLPVMPGLPPARSASQEELRSFRLGALRWTAPSSLTGSAQVLAPVTHGASGLTYGVGLLGARGADGALLDALCTAFGGGPLATV
jgi:amidase